MHIFTTSGRQYDVNKLISITRDNPIYLMKMKKLKHNLRVYIWDKMSVRPIDIIRSRRGSHYKRIKDADISYPILVWINKDMKIYIIDGNHRYCRALLDKQKKIQVKFVPEIQMESARL